jgi:galactokinase
MLGGGDKGASGALVKADSADALRAAIEKDYPAKQPEYADKFAMHVCKVVDGIKVMDF